MSDAREFDHGDVVPNAPAETEADRAARRAAECTALKEPVPRRRMQNLTSNAQALLDLDKDGALVPHGIGGHARTIITEFIVENARLTARIEELEKALKPFAVIMEEARRCHPSFDRNPDECVLEVFYGDDPTSFAYIKFGDLRFARSTLEAGSTK